MCTCAVWANDYAVRNPQAAHNLGIASYVVSSIGIVISIIVVVIVVVLGNT